MDQMIEQMTNKIISYYNPTEFTLDQIQQNYAVIYLISLYIYNKSLSKHTRKLIRHTVNKIIKRLIKIESLYEREQNLQQLVFNSPISILQQLNQEFDCLETNLLTEQLQIILNRTQLIENRSSRKCDQVIIKICQLSLIYFWLDFVKDDYIEQCQQILRNNKYLIKRFEIYYIIVPLKKIEKKQKQTYIPEEFKDLVDFIDTRSKDEILHNEISEGE